MGQRLGVAAALLGQPQTVVLDEPVNGLDPDGVRWIRLLLRSLADEGRTVFVSSHLISEMAQTATRLVIVGRGRLIAETSVEDFIGRAAVGDVLVRTPEATGLGHVLAGPGSPSPATGRTCCGCPAPPPSRSGRRRGGRTYRCSSSRPPGRH